MSPADSADPDLTPDAADGNGSPLRLHYSAELEQLRLQTEVMGVRRLEARVAVVTGAGHGIGAATAKRLARDGALVAVCDLRPQAADQTAAQIVSAGGRAQAFIADVADRSAVGGLVAEIERELGPIEILDNNAGRLVPGTALTQEIEEWERTLSVNVGSVFLMCRGVLPGRRERG